MTLQCTIKSRKLETKVKIKNENDVQESKTKSARAKELENSLLKWKQALAEVKLSETNDRLLQKSNEVEAQEVVIQEAWKKLKQSQSLSHYYRGKSEKCSGATRKMNVASSLESALSQCLPNKHPTTKASCLMDEITSGRLLSGEALKLTQEFARIYLRDLFKPWRMLKAADISSVGAFKTSTIKALNEVIDHERLGLFPSASSVDRARAKLDQYAFEVIGYERRGTVYGEVFF